MDKMRRWVRNQRGSILLFTVILVLPLMIIIGGLAMDLAYYGTVDDELQRSMDAAALAGAGTLGFNKDVFPAARLRAQDFALANPYRVGPINLDLNTANDKNGNIVLGNWGLHPPTATKYTFEEWDPATNPNPSNVNAVQCRFETTAPTSFLRLIGVPSINAGAMAIAWAAQPNTTPPNACVLPIGLSSCFFGSNDAGGCGATVSFITSSAQGAVGDNTAAWVNLFPPGNVNANDVKNQMTDAVEGKCNGTALNQGLCQSGGGIPTSNGELQPVINYLMGKFPQIYNSSPPEITVLKQDGTPAYIGHGWEVFVPVIDTGPNCGNIGAITGCKDIVGWARFVVTQVFNSNGTCAVANHWAGNPWDAHCLTSKNGTAPGPLPPGFAGQKGLFGYFDCKYSPVPPAPDPGPITATAKLKLVK